ncbi:ParB N-terminal domain-containing protein [Bradyrhizobium sp. BWC-3-1]|uniref:ParB N-terminal domain-containing protein n=1 Tax=Bradyrhizobium sp. BWC-3-1 TaxID=3080012 RepID=UPI003978BCFE
MPTLVAGRHRLKACKRLKLKSVQCRVVNADDDEVRAWATLTEIDENLIRPDPTPAQRAKLIAKRKAAYEAVHPETRTARPERGALSFAILAKLRTASRPISRQDRETGTDGPARRDPQPRGRDSQPARPCARHAWSMAGCS